jgi:hypothetical protein
MMSASPGGRPLSDVVQRLLRCADVHQLHECEVAWPATALAIANDSLPPLQPPTAQAAMRPVASVGAAAPPTGAGVKLVPGVKAALLARLQPAGEAFLARSAQWAWDQRFFVPGAGGDAAVARLRALAVAELLADLRRGAPLSLYVGGLAPLLLLLAALRVRQAPATVPGFGAFLLCECWEVGGGAGAAPGVALTLRACEHPFPHTREGMPARLSVSLRTLFEDVSLDALAALSAPKPVAQPSGGGGWVAGGGRAGGGGLAAAAGVMGPRK